MISYAFDACSALSNVIVLETSDFMIAGYSGTPLPSKLGIKPSSNLLLLGAPDGYAAILRPLPPGVRLKKRADKTVDVVQVFVTRREQLEKHLAVLRKKLNSDAAIWVSWPKKASKVPTSVSEDTIRELAFPLGLVDIKVCAVNEIWSGLTEGGAPEADRHRDAVAPAHWTSGTMARMAYPVGAARGRTRAMVVTRNGRYSSVIQACHTSIREAP